MHRSVHVLLTRSSGELILQRRALDRAVAPGLLDSSAAGHVAAGESYLDCAHRETAEELGVDGRQFRALMLLPAEAATGNEFCLVMHLVHDGELAPCPREIIALEPVGQELLLQRIAAQPDDFAPTLKRIVSQLQSEGRWPLRNTRPSESRR
jgi:isopentenyldiphosphate isomerase